jgi:hypothetical protein
LVHGCITWGQKRKGDWAATVAAWRSKAGVSYCIIGLSNISCLLVFKL